MRASRLLTILLTLQLRGRATAQELADQLEVSKRTIYRDVDELSAAGVPIHADRGVGGGFALLRGFKTELTGLTPHESEALLFASLPGAAADLGLGEPASLSRLKLLAALPAPTGELARQVADRFHLDPVDWYRRAEPPQHLRTVAAAVWEGRQLKLLYESWTQTRRRVVDPLGLVMKAGQWYLLARGSKSIQILRISNMIEAEITPERFYRPDIDLPALWAEKVRAFEQGLRAGTATLRVADRVLGLVTRLGADMSAPILAAEPDAAGWRTAAVPIESIGNAATLLLSLADGVEVLEPEALRDELATRAGRILEIYQPSRQRSAA